MPKSIAATAVIVTGIAITPASAVAQGAALRPPAAFAQCAVCHATKAGGPRRIGPDLVAVVGRVAATKPGFAYSPALRKANIRWTDATLDRWLQQPARMVPGNRMAFAGLPNPGDRAKVIAYLKSLK